AYARTLGAWMTDEALWKRFSDGALRHARRFLETGLRPEVDLFFRRCIAGSRTRAAIAARAEHARRLKPGSETTPPTS
ncbi:MAG: hypothetical protein L3K13_08765, partial [Thermoplasmata archaeon]|nr:hypothetical protein [Thermoplasmata archaeon]